MRALKIVLSVKVVGVEDWTEDYIALLLIFSRVGFD